MWLKNAVEHNDPIAGQQTTQKNAPEHEFPTTLFWKCFLDFRMWTLYGENWILGLQASGVQLRNRHQISGSTDVRIVLGWHWFRPEG